LAWHRKFAPKRSDSFQPRQSVGRPHLAKDLEDLVVRMARENRSWGYDRIVGALTNLGYRLSDQTVGNILKRHGAPPAPERKQATTWQEFVRFHLDVLSTTDFFNHEVWSWLRLVISSFLFFCLYFDGRKIRVAVIMAWRDACWMLPRPRWDRPWHADVERWERVVIKKGLSRLLLSGEGVCRPVLSEFSTHDRLDRPPQGMGKVVLLPPANCRQIRDGPMRFQQRCSGLLISSYREAA
jgi:hypothetical protein